MKQKHAQAYRTDARAILASINAAIGQDFDTLTSGQVDALLAQADIRRYQKPKNANGSRGRYFFQLIQRRAK